MSILFSEEEVIAQITRLSRTQLTAFIRAKVVTPLQSDQGHRYSRMDVVRMELLCDLSEQFDLEGDALGIVISLIDQLHGVRAELHNLIAAVAAEPDEVRARIAQTLRTNRPTATD